MKAAQLSLGDLVDVKEEHGRIVIECKRPNSFSLRSLLDGITTANRHHAINTGAAVGQEAW